ncbi:hypothetical protein BCV69DRAFT_246772 [Microstroma glucosiphilum]|uniref:Uncharacterized protein n=1 Tax=Pseudomicrostroma glucosiphilum TaxID=1684307 RepID=A0A316UB24_9BASI|nr:hypothetical protein BCV69DRAFT_246772 [Pseudomicrostroma glucosiphilum]PWN22362.1 hypothetical protein BCV69DRAFT_246772 [Pseudomicrostroma glucosiphilum]
MTAAQFAKVHAQYNALDVPHSVVFPFLHGVDGDNVAQNTFFRAPLSGQPAPNYRGLTVVRADLPTPAQQAQMMKQHQQEQRRRNDCVMVETASFFTPPQNPGVNLRNFKIQAAKYATISDIVIYCPFGIHEGAVTLAKWFREAQETCWENRLERKLGGLRYNVFVVTEAFDAFEQFPHLIAIDRHGVPHDRVDFVDREREEMQRLTTATAIDDNVWLGCSADVPLIRANPNGFSICIECHDAADVPDSNKLQHASQFLDAYDSLPARSEGKGFDGDGPSDLVHLECSSVSGLTEEAQFAKAASDILNLCAWIKAQAQPPKAALTTSTQAAVPSKRLPHRVLLHCGDGYTETSILALAYLMYARGLSLPEAYLDLQERAKRSFFVYARDVAFLKKLEHSAPSNVDLMGPPSRALTPTPASVRAAQSAAAATKEATASHAWFTNPRFEGAFPSRILPFLYLGNLNHALNPAMLHALGITHVVSVGESALHPPAASAAAQAGRISVLDLKNVSDDGIDPLRSTMRVAVEYIESARRSGGKVLVHCRVGVSRSTTIVLAYVMAHLDMTLVESYLLVRSRRLSILIQPHLLFFWELRGWETFVASQKAKRQQALREHSAMTSDGQVAAIDCSLEAKKRAQPTLPPRQLTNKPVGASCGFAASQQQDDAFDLDVDIGQGAGSPYGFGVANVADRAFGSGSPSGIKADALRLNWGFLCREIAALNERYF